LKSTFEKWFADWIREEWIADEGKLRDGTERGVASPSSAVVPADLEADEASVGWASGAIIWIVEHPVIPSRQMPRKLVVNFWKSTGRLRAEVANSFVEQRSGNNDFIRRRFG